MFLAQIKAHANVFVIDGAAIRKLKRAQLTAHILVQI